MRVVNAFGSTTMHIESHIQDTFWFKVLNLIPYKCNPPAHSYPSLDLGGPRPPQAPRTLPIPQDYRRRIGVQTLGNHSKAFALTFDIYYKV